MYEKPHFDQSRLTRLAGHIRQWGEELGFQQIGFSRIDLGKAEPHFEAWIASNYHGNMAYMARHGRKRTRPALLVPDTLTIITARMDYLPANDNPKQILSNPDLGYISRYALGRDYHKMMRKRLQRLSVLIAEQTGPFSHRVFVDSAPVLEKPIAALAGLGWQGKHSNLINRDAGGWFFLGEIYTNLPLPTDQPEANHCGRCDACIRECPTGAIVAPYQVDARSCISYLTIEHPGSIPETLRPLMGNRIYGCDDCLLACPWNRFARPTTEMDFQPREGLDASQLVALFGWSESTFLKRLEGSPIRRIGHQRWLRNIAVALGNAPASYEAVFALKAQQEHPDPVVREHVHWALQQQKCKRGAT